MLKPTNNHDDSKVSLRDESKLLQRVDDLKDKIRVLVETPLFTNADLLKHDLVE
jgi:hypothetical protein